MIRSSSLSLNNATEKKLKILLVILKYYQINIILNQQLITEKLCLLIYLI